MPSTSELPAAAAAGAARTGTVDCDLWGYKPGFSDLSAHLAASWRHWLRLEEPPTPGVRILLPESQYFVAGGAVDAPKDVDEAVAALRAHLDRTATASAVFNPGAASSISGLSNPILAGDVARAVNDWTGERWLDADDRLLGSIVVSAREPARAAAEIRRAGADPRMVQVLFAYPPQLLGSRTLAPIYEAATELDLVVGLQAGGDFSGTNGGVTRLGLPGGSRLEALVAWEYGAQPHLVNLLASDTLERFPSLRFVLSGFGVAWLPSLLWRLDDEILKRRIELPRSLSRPASEIVAERVRLTTSTVEVPPRPEALSELLSSIDGRALLLHGTGPRREPEDNDGLTIWPAEWRGAVGGDNARSFYPRLAS